MVVAVREYGCLSTSGVPSELDHQLVSSADFEFLKAAAIEQESLTDAFRLIARDGREMIQAQNFVGVVAMPSGEQLEIVPKITNDFESVEEGRYILLKMLSTIVRLEYRESGFASLETLRRPWLEALITHMLKAIATLVRLGMRKHYIRISAQRPFLRGQLLVAAQMRQRLGRQHQFHISYDEYSSNRPENRLIRSALEQLNRWSTDPENQRLCGELLFVMDEVPSSQEIANDLMSWGRTRDMIRYAPLLPWVRLVLMHQSPIFSHGHFEGVSLLFPMEKLFEQYVADRLKRDIHPTYEVRAQLRAEYLVRHQERPLFQLNPDITVLHGNSPVSILDTKWKLIDGALDDRSSKYRLNQTDLYQLFAYGQKYLNGKGDLFLIFPSHVGFREPLSAFYFSEGLRLWVVPFDCGSDQLVWPSDNRIAFVNERVGAEIA